eukprot:scaffold93099_cov66-Phaeocystis_antarctica.AAC.8
MFAPAVPWKTQTFVKALPAVLNARSFSLKAFSTVHVDLLDMAALTLHQAHVLADSLVELVELLGVGYAQLLLLELADHRPGTHALCRRPPARLAFRTAPADVQHVARDRLGWIIYHHLVVLHATLVARAPGRVHRVEASGAYILLHDV